MFKNLSVFAALFIFVIVLMLGCGKKGNETPVNNTQVVDKPVHIEFLGHSSFRITSADSICIVTDPFGNTISFLQWPDTVKADIVTISHEHADHNQTSPIKGNPVILRSGQVDTISSVRISAYRTRHGDWNGQTQGYNWIYVFEIDDIKIVHLGETASFDDDIIMKAIENADVMLVPVGQVASLSFAEAKTLIDTTGARIVIPQHYSPAAGERFYNSSTADEFIDFIGTALPVSYKGSIDVLTNPPKQVIVMSALFAK